MATEDKFQSIIKGLILPFDDEPVSGINITGQFKDSLKNKYDIAKKINAAFLLKLSGPGHDLYNEAVDYLTTMSQDPGWKDVVSFFLEGEKVISNEIKDCYKNESGFKQDLNELYSWVKENPDIGNKGDVFRRFRNFFFPEGKIDLENKDIEINKLRDLRKVNITALNKNPVEKPESEILFTSNVLLTVPSQDADINDLNIDEKIKADLLKIFGEEQLYWYDHPIQIGISPEKNEVIYGLEKLDEALAFEEEVGHKDRDKKVDCLLSVSVTHRGLQDLSKSYIESELKNNSNIKRLNVYVFTEKDCEEIINSLLIPVAEKFSSNQQTELLHEIFGVDGEYGRHYSFLKAIGVFWNIFISAEIKGTFKIDLDQVFPQEKLLKESGCTAFEHLKTPLWGASGKDCNNKNVHLGLIAGALVNEKDIGESIFTPDVKFPRVEKREDSIVFYSTLPQALSTEAEMQTRYEDGTAIDGKNNCIQRIHVTGGTNGILIESLRKYRPFTPGFIGRAEDQSYILSVLFDDPGTGYLRYVHSDGLIMRHDKEAFASEAIEAARLGKIIGDYIRIIFFSYYAELLTWPVANIKNAIDPFTGCFVSRLPWTTVYLRYVLKTAHFFATGKNDDGYDILKMGVERLSYLFDSLSAEKNFLGKRFDQEKEGWNMFYDIMDIIEKKLNDNDSFTHGLKLKAEEIVRNCRLKL